jgi:hypothetical protein
MMTCVALVVPACARAPGTHDRATPTRLAAVERVRELGGVVTNRYFFGFEHSWGYPIVELGDSWNGGDEELVHVAAMESIDELWLNSSEITDKGVQHVADLKHLAALHCDGTRLTDAGLGRLADVYGLNCIDISGTRLTDAGLEALENCNLLWLFVQDAPQITDAG